MTSTWQALFSIDQAIDHPVVRIVGLTTVSAILLGLAAAWLLGQKKPDLARDIRTRTLTWIALSLLTLGPILAGRAWAILLVCVLSLACYREFARATGLFRHTLASASVVLGILAITFTHIDNWPGLRTGLIAYVPLLILIGAILQDEPKGYVQRCALACSAFLLFGVGLGRLGTLTATVEYRAVLCAIIFSCQLSDVAAYCCGKAMGGPKLFPQTSPNKTLAGHLGALLIITPLSAGLYHLAFAGTPIAAWPHAITLGLLTAALAQLGDLVIGSIKRDVGVKDMGAILPGHGGVLDRCNSLLLVAPIVYHYANYFAGPEIWIPQRLITGGVP